MSNGISVGTQKTQQASILADEEEEVKHKATEKAVRKDHPDQPLPGSAISVQEMWRMVKQQFQEMTKADVDTSKAGIERKQSVMDGVQKSQLNQINDRMKELDEQIEAKKAAEAMQVLTWIGAGLAIFASVVIAGLSCGAAAPLSAIIISMVVAGAVSAAATAAAMYLPQQLDNILKSFGVPEETRMICCTIFEFAIILLSAFLPPNPAAFAKLAAKGATAAAKAATKAVPKLMRMSKSVMSAASSTSKVGKKAMDLWQKGAKFIEKINDKGLLTGLQRAGAAMSAGATAVSAGYGIRMAVDKEAMDKSIADAELLEAVLNNILEMIDKTMKNLEHSVDNLLKVSDDQRDFSKDAISTHMK